MRGPTEIAILGGGSWGTALSLHLARAGRPVALWVHDPVLASRMASERLNDRYLGGHPLPAGVRVTGALDDAMKEAQDILVVVPSHHCRHVLDACRPFVTERMRFCVASKGIENETLLTVSGIVRDVLGLTAFSRTAVLSGPSFAEEVARGHPTALVVGGSDPDLVGHFQERFSAGSLRVYTNSDSIGVELGGALKNVIAIGAGAVEGLGYGTNTLAALITRGLAEISRLAVAMGGRSGTLAGLAGLGDLVLTCTGRLSRNRATGEALARGVKLAQYEAGTPMVAEGVRTTRSAWLLAQRHRVEMPITEQVHALLYEGKPPAEAIRELLARQLTNEDI
ncbi:MAG TPA: NAD(P)H-dependent glycerol-3-phosphate dehydrogenase [Candidatus Polarisedimenticolia bacterium]|jgi:glycerol-3-phosphate dehydrogenase (NAD(P)+)